MLVIEGILHVHWLFQDKVGLSCNAGESLGSVCFRMLVIPSETVHSGHITKHLSPNMTCCGLIPAPEARDSSPNLTVHEAEGEGAGQLKVRNLQTFTNLLFCVSVILALKVVPRGTTILRHPLEIGCKASWITNFCRCSSPLY
jgi:hypothetical protein